jgi:hypothetical protein
MQIAHRKTQTDHKMLSDRTDVLAARVNAVQADLRGVMHGDDEVEALRARVQSAEDLLAELRGRLSAAEVALAEAKTQAQAQAQVADQGAEVVVTEVSARTRAPSPLCAHTSQSDVAPVATMTTPMHKLKPLAELRARLAVSEAIEKAKRHALVLRQVAKQGAEVVVTEVSARTSAPSALCAHMSQSDVAPVATTTTPTRKRKRTEDEDEDGSDFKGEEEQGNPVRANVQARKRARGCVSAAVHTTAAIVVGAVAAWSALAFV